MADKVEKEHVEPIAASEVKQRLADARAQKALVEADLQEGLFFIRPRLARSVSSTTKPAKTKNDDVDDLATGIGQEVSQDFATEAIAAFFPQHTNWTETEVPEAYKGDQAVVDAISEFDAKVFEQIRRSNFNAELGVAMDPNMSIGTVALWIDAPGAGRPYRVEDVPLRELEINIGPDGEVDDRFRVRWVRGSKLGGVLSAALIAKLPEKTRTKIKGKDCWIECVWGFWRDWNQPEDDVFVHVVMVDGHVLHHDPKLVGEGSVPLIVMPFSPDRLHAFGNGPGIAALQEFRVLDVITAATEDRVDIAIAPPIAYDDDGVIDFSDGIEAGKAYPRRPGSKFDKLYFDGDPDMGFLTADQLEKRIRRKFFADYPEQRGDTPPTATQWIDEMLRAQRRIGTPGLHFWSVGPRQVFLRFAWLAEKDGLVDWPTIDGKRLTLTPNNPATQAQDQQQVQTGLHLLDISKTYFPTTSQAAIDEMKTIANFKEKLKDKLVAFRSAEESKSFLQQIIGQVRGMMGGGGDAPAG